MKAFRILFLFSLCASLVCQGKDRTRKDAEKVFDIVFFDTVYIQSVSLTLHFDDSVTDKPYELIFKKDTTASDTTKQRDIRVRFEEPLNMQKLESELNKALIYRYGGSKTVSQMSVFEVFYWIYATTHVDTSRPQSGVLNLGTYVLVTEGGSAKKKSTYNKIREKGNIDTFSTYQRIRFSDSLIDRVKHSTFKRDELYRQRQK